MSNSKSHILGNIRRGLKRDKLSDAARTALQERLSNPPRNPIPARSLLDHAGQVQLFREMANEAAAELHTIKDLQALPVAVAQFMAQEGHTQLVLADASEFNQLDWSPCDSLSLARRPAQDGDPISLTPSFAGIAETGTLMLHSGPESPTTLNFLPDIHLVTLRESRIVGPYEDAWQLVRQERQGLPRCVNMITGPSRSADIEQRLQMGAHGPKRLVIFLIED